MESLQVLYLIASHHITLPNRRFKLAVSSRKVDVCFTAVKNSSDNPNTYIEPGFFHSTLVCKNDPKSFEYNSISYDAAEPESTMKENQKEIFSQLNGHGRKADPLTTKMKDKDGYWNTPELEYSVVVDNFTNSNGKEAKDPVVAAKVPNELSQDSDLYTAKNVMECDLPELIVCYKESTWHAVKDICVDEGLPSENKFSAKSLMDDHSSLPSNGYKHTDMIKEVVITDFLVQNDLRSSPCKDCTENAANDSVNKVEVDKDLLIPDRQNSSSEGDIDQENVYKFGVDGLHFSTESGKDLDAASFCDSGDLIQSGKEICKEDEKITDDAMTSKIVSNSMLLVKELRNETSLKFLLESSKCGDNDIGQQCNQAILQVPEVSMIQESNKSIHVDNLVYNSKVESGIITLSFDSTKLAAINRDKSHENVIAQALKSENKPIHDVGVSDNLVVNSQVKRGEGGESSFSVAGPLSDVVPYSGSIPFSGSISLRSDSSTTSTRSFAFPVLQNEWNSSPVRMAKADRRHFRNRGRRLGLLCCRF